MRPPERLVEKSDPLACGISNIKKKIKIKWLNINYFTSLAVFKLPCRYIINHICFASLKTPSRTLFVITYKV